MASVIEIRRFRVKAGEEQAFLEDRARMMEVLRSRFPEMRDICLARLDDGAWVAVASWGSREDADRASAEAADIPAFGALITHIEDEGPTIERGMLAQGVAGVASR